MGTIYKKAMRGAGAAAGKKYPAAPGGQFGIL